MSVFGEWVWMCGHANGMIILSSFSVNGGLRNDSSLMELNCNKSTQDLSK